MTCKPVSSHERFTLLDALRGFAIFGIFGINMMAASFNWGNYNQEYYSLGKADEIFEMLMNAFIEGKFYSIFSLLFGIGFGLQLTKHNNAGIDGLPLFKRRLWGLLFIGLMHMLVIWVGDILFLYAWLGFILIAFRHKSDRWLLKSAVVCLLIPVILFPLRFINPVIGLGAPIFMLIMALTKGSGFDMVNFDPVSFFGAPGWVDYFKANVLAFFFRQADLFDQVRPFKVFAVFLVGFWVSRHKWYQYPEKFLAWAKPYIVWVLPLAVGVNLGMAAISWDAYYGGQPIGWLKTLLYFLGVVPLSLCYVYLFAKAYMSGKHKWLNGFSYVGRMALTNYLMQSVLYMVLFRGPFFALAGKVGLIALMAPVVVFFFLQILFSRWWLQHYQYGPLEWLWRSFTYRKWQDLKRKDKLVLSDT